jgi:hypothetical protein
MLSTIYLYKFKILPFVLNHYLNRDKFKYHQVGQKDKLNRPFLKSYLFYLMNYLILCLIKTKKKNIHNYKF